MQPVFKRVCQRQPGCIDNVGRAPNGPPDVVAIGRLDRHTDGRSRRALFVQDADLVIGQADDVDIGVVFVKCLSQGRIERIDWPVPFGRSVVSSLPHTNLDHRLRQ